jgi:hypothetical protein
MGKAYDFGDIQLRAWGQAIYLKLSLESVSGGVMKKMSPIKDALLKQLLLWVIRTSSHIGLWEMM